MDFEILTISAVNSAAICESIEDNGTGYITVMRLHGKLFMPIEITIVEFWG